VLDRSPVKLISRFDPSASKIPHSCIERMADKLSTLF
jgi:hypothetical protein